MKFAVWMVVRDDEYYVDMAIKSVLPYVDGIYILDNGSEDGTIETIESFDSAKILLEKIKYDVPSHKKSPYWGFDPQYDGNSLEAQTRNLCVKNCIEAFNPAWLIQIDADEVYTKLFFETLNNLDLHNLTAVQHSTDRFCATDYISRQPTIWAGDRYDPHHRSWNGNLNVKWHRYEGNHVVPEIMPGHQHFGGDTAPWLDGIIHIHLHRMFGPKSVEFWGTPKEAGVPYNPRITSPKLFAEQMQNAKKVAFDWDKELPFVIEKWREWGVW